MILKRKTTMYHTVEVVDHVICDLCRERFPGLKENGGVVSQWPADSDEDDIYSFWKTGITMETGNDWPEGKSTELKAFHICPKCFEEKLIPWMASQGAEPTITKINTL